jgi:hypothetical protein
MLKSTLAKVLFTITLVGTVLFACKKKDNDTPTPTKQELFSGKTSKTWQIQKLYINDTLYGLSSQELQYTVTYNSDSTYVDSEGMGGKYLMDNAGTKLIETLTIGGSGKFTYNIETLNEASLIMRLVDDGSGKNPNMQYHYRAK